ncbi:TetR/AcrR family transcriptional regulator [Actinomadura keratinilytica]|uniref:TetR/AcrR family transcriptional regulator n=2 Tax=Actinomadura keratinilytica TaxID=547461 RepID=A0ABP7Z9X6_9ACTN
MGARMPSEPVPAARGAGRAAGRGRRRPRLNRGDRQEIALLDSVERLVGGKPLAEITLDEIAAGAGLSRAAVYFYFDGRDAVLRAALDRAIEAGMGILDAHAGRGLGEALADIMADFLGWWRRKGGLICAIIDQSGRDAQLRDAWRAFFERSGGILAEALERDRAAGLVPDLGDAREMCVALTYMCERNFYMLFSREHRAEEEEELCALLVRLSRRALGYPAS